MYLRNSYNAYPLMDRSPKHGEVDVWNVDLDSIASHTEDYADLLSSDERQRAAEFRFARDRDEFVICRGVLRLVLSGYIGIPAREIHFAYNRYGKPMLGVQKGSEEWKFNVSHSRGVALIAVSVEQDVGIDIEFMGESSAIEDAAAIFFSPAEESELNLAPPRQQKDLAFDIWTRKEACLKAIGAGFAYPPHELTVSATGEPQIINARTEFSKSQEWSIIALPVKAGYKAALAIEGTFKDIHHLKWAGDGLSLRPIPEFVSKFESAIDLQEMKMKVCAE